MNTLAKLTGLTASDLFLNEVTPEMRVEAVKAEALSLVFDTTTAKGREECISHAAKVGKTKTGIEKLGKALVDPIKAESKVIDVERKFYKDELGALQAEVRKPVTLWEEKQAAIKAAIDQHFFELEQAGISTSPATGELLSEVQLQKKLDHLNSVDLKLFGDQDEKAEIMAKAGWTRITAALKQSKDAQELLDLRLAETARKATEEKEADRLRIIAEYEEKKVAEAESPIVTEKKYDMPSHSPMSKILPEITEARKTKLSVNQALVKAFCSAGGEHHCGINEGQARVILTAIAKDQIPNISVNYEAK
jgi:colicin import membrane protein